MNYIEITAYAEDIIIGKSRENEPLQREEKDEENEIMKMQVEK